MQFLASTKLIDCGTPWISRSCLQLSTESKSDLGNLLRLSAKVIILIPLKLNIKNCKHSISGWISGNFSSLRQPLSLKDLRDFNLSWLGRNWSFEHKERFQLWSFLRSPTDSSISTKFLHPSRSNVSKFGVHEATNFVINSQCLKLACFKFWNWKPCRKKFNI